MGEETGDPLEVPVCQSIIVPVAKGLVINKKTAKAVSPAKEMSCPWSTTREPRESFPTDSGIQYGWRMRTTKLKQPSQAFQ